MSDDHSMHMMNGSGGHQGMSNMGHDMSGMDHSHMHHQIDQGATDDHSAHVTMGSTGSMAMSHMMSMAFHGGYNEVILFEAWKISSLAGLIGSIIGIVIMAALYEGLKYYREYLFWKTYNALQYRSVSMPQEKNVANDENRIVHMVGEVIHKQPPTMLSWMHAFQTLLHIVQITLSYLLMLIFMTYNTWLCCGVVLGAAIGYFLFGWKKSVIVDVTEHCH